MTQVFLTHASTSPWSVPAGFNATGHTVELIGSGGNGAAGNGTIGGGGGGGGGYGKFTYSSGTITPGSTTIAFLIGAGGSAANTCWQNTTNTNANTAGDGGNGSGGTAGIAGAAGATAGSPAITYTTTTSKAGGAGGGATGTGGAGGGGSGGPANSGGTGFPVSGATGGGGGGANNGATGNGASGAGGQGSSGTPGTGGIPGTAGTGNSGGGPGGSGGGDNSGGAGGSGTDFDGSHGCGAGAGGAGFNAGTGAKAGGPGGSYGGGGGGGNKSGTTSTGGGGLIVITYTVLSAALVASGLAMVSGAATVTTQLSNLSVAVTSPGQCYILELYPYKRGTTAGGLLFAVPIGTEIIGYIAPVVDPNSGVVEVDYSDAGYTSPPTGTKPNIWFSGRASQPLHMQRTLPITPEGSRRVALAIVGIEIVNSDGDLDSALREYSIDGRQVVVKFGLKGNEYQTFTTVYSGRAAAWKGTLDKVDIVARDEAYRLAVPLQSSLYGGTGGADGPSGLTGKPKPLCFGQCFNITPTLIDSSALVYQFHSRTVQSVDAVYDRGAAVTGPDADYADYATLIAASITAGHYVTCKAQGLFRVASTPTGLVTADVQGDASGGYVNDTSSIVKRILKDFGGLSDSDLDLPGFSTVLTTVPGAIGWYQDTNSILIENAMDEIVGGCSCWWGGLPTGMISIGRVEAPDAGVISADLKAYDVIDAQIIEPQQNTFPPRFRQRVTYAKNWTVQNGIDLAGSVTAARRLALAQPYSVAQSTSGTTQADFALAQDLLLESLFVNQSDAAAEAARLTAMLGSLTQSVQITQTVSGHLLQLGSTVQLTYPRINGGQPWLARAIGQDVDAQNRRVVTTLWG